MADIKEQLDKADALNKSHKHQEAADFLRTLADQSNPEVLWRLARALYELGDLDANASKKPDLIREAYKLASEALAKDDQSCPIHAWYAILLDAKGQVEGLKERATNLMTVKQHMERAVELNPNDFVSRYILGEFAYGIADMPWYQRKIVAAVFAAPPTGTYEEALEHYLKAETVETSFHVKNKLMIGKCFQQLKNNDKAKEYFLKAINAEHKTEEDHKAKKEAEGLLKKCK